jgi:hypothetical protein
MVLCHFGGDGVCLGGLLPKDFSGRAGTVLKEQQFMAPSKQFHSFFHRNMAPPTKRFSRVASKEAEPEQEPQRSSIKWGADNHSQCPVCGVKHNCISHCAGLSFRGGWRWSIGAVGQPPLQIGFYKSIFQKSQICVKK